MSSGREPIASPPGRATFARPVRASNGPSTQIDPRILRTSSYGASEVGRSGTFTRTLSTRPCTDSVTSQPSRPSSSCMVVTSEIAGRLAIVVSPGASSAAAISFNTLFLAPTTETSPASRAPPVTRRTCTCRGYRHGVAVHLTRIYTRAGDDGTTALGDMSRVPKTDTRVGAFADCDETNAVVGVALALGALPDPIAAVLRQVQNDLFDVGADLCNPVVADPAYPPLRITPSTWPGWKAGATSSTPIWPSWTASSFPAERPPAALLHHARTVARRAERHAWALYADDPERTNREAIRYLNRLSDLLFILARVANPDGDVKWRPGGAG